MAIDTHVPPADAQDPAHVEARQHAMDHLRAVLESFERGESPSFLLVYQERDHAPRFTYSVTGEGNRGHMEAAAALLLAMEEVRGAIDSQGQTSRLAWRAEEGA